MTVELENLAKYIHALSMFHSIENIELSGIYAIWWTGDLSLLELLNRDIHLQGKQITIKERGEKLHNGTYHIHKTKWDWNLGKTPVCLYVGKANNILKRLKQHLELRIPSDKWFTSFNIRRQGKLVPKNPCIDEHFLVKRTSACQIRAGIEHLFKNQESSTIQQKLNNFGISFLIEPDFINRFYFEDLAIGYYRPWFNLDSER